MKLTAVDLYRYTVPLTAPLALKGDAMRERTGFLIHLRDDNGYSGWGEAAPLPGFSQESHGEAAAHLREAQSLLRGRKLIGNPVDPSGSFAEWLDQQAWAASVRMGIETAAWHLFAEAEGVTLPQALCETSSDTVPLNGLLLGSNEAIIERARQLPAAGYRAVKLKVGRQSVAADVALVREVHAALGPSMALRLDANRRWSLEEALAFATGVADVLLAYIEEPLQDPAQLERLASETRLPIALDETLVGMPVAALQDHAYACAVVLKPTVLGGLIHTLRLARAAREQGLTPVLSAAFETGVGLRALIALAACLGDTPVGLDTYGWLAEDVLAPRLAWQGATIDVEALMRANHRVEETDLEPVSADT